MRILHLTLKKKWFDMIASGEKKEEYREVKPYWEKRLGNVNLLGETFIMWYDQIKFVNGYGRHRPTIYVKWVSIEIREGKPEWGAMPGVEYYVIKFINPLHEKEKQFKPQNLSDIV